LNQRVVYFLQGFGGEDAAGEQQHHCQLELVEDAGGLGEDESLKLAFFLQLTGKISQVY